MLLRLASRYLEEMTDNHSHLWPGVPLALGSAILFGASAPLSKLLMGSIDPWLLAGILYLGAGVGLAAVHWGRPFLGLPNVEAPLLKSDIPWLAAVIVFGGVLGPLFLMLGLSQTTASSGSLLLNLEGLATMGIAWLVFRENVDARLSEDHGRPGRLCKPAEPASRLRRQIASAGHEFRPAFSLRVR